MGFEAGSRFYDDRVRPVTERLGSQIRPDHLALGRYETFVSLLGLLFTMYISGILVLYIVLKRVRCLADSFQNRLGSLLRLSLLGFLAEVLVVCAGIGSA